MRKRILAGLAILSLALSGIAQASVTVGSTRLIYDGKLNEANLTVSNRDDDSPYLVQSWVSGYGTGSDASLDQFIVTPPLFRLDANKENILRVILTSGDIPQDRESLFLMNVKAIPALRDDQRDKNVLQIALKTTIKMFYRPTGLAGAAKDAAASLAWSAAGGNLAVDNPSKFHVVVSELKINDQALTSPTDVLRPGEHRVLPVKVKSGDRISMSYIDDYGTSISAPVITLR